MLVVCADVGQEVHGFVAKTDSIAPNGSSSIVRFTPVCDIAALRQEKFPYRYGNRWVHDPRKRKPEDLVLLLLRAAKGVDEEKICDQGPTIGEDVTVTN
jgi:hypothetical protein